MEGPSRRPSNPCEQLSVADVLQDVEPMGDLSPFAIEDRTPEVEDEFFRILEEA